MKLEKKHWAGIVLGFAILVVGVIFLRIGDKISWFLIVLSGVIVVLPFFVSFLLGRGTEKELEERFLEFVRDLVENVKSGTPISKGIINLRSREYGPLTAYVDKLSNQITLGIPLTAALATFARDTRSDVILRAVNLISEAEKAGGQIDTILESVSRSVNQIDELKKERKSTVYNLIVQGYVIFMVFIIIMLMLQYKILPLTSNLGGSSGLDISGSTGLPSGSSTIDTSKFPTMIFVLLLIQSLFAGLVIGKISEGSLKDGIKHSFILIVLTLLVKAGAYAVFGA